VGNKRRAWRSYEDARKFARKLKVSGRGAWEVYACSGDRPKDIPSSPEVVYGEEFVDWHDFLGTEKIEYLPYAAAKRYAVALKLKGREEWIAHCQSGKKPKNIPMDVKAVYGEEFEHWGVFLGYGFTLAKTIEDRRRYFQGKFVPYEQAKAYALTLNLRGLNDWRAYRISGKKPLDIPTSPDTTYGDLFEGWGTFLGTGNVALFQKKFLSYRKTKAFLRNLGIKSALEWSEYCRSGQRPQNIPACPDTVYKGEFEGWNRFLGTVPKQPPRPKPQYRSYRSAKIYLSKLGLKGWSDWREFADSDQRPADIPKNLHLHYKPEFQLRGGLKAMLGVKTSAKR
jgi:hypothetical protein